MQLQPATARSTARYYKRPTPALTDLFDPYINTALGAARLRMLLDEFDDQIPVALAGYNAGPNAAMRWLPQEPLDSDIWIENIPYNETRGYVQRILWQDQTLHLGASIVLTCAATTCQPSGNRTQVCI